jgi:hypothetical protein
MRFTTRFPDRRVLAPLGAFLGLALGGCCGGISLRCQPPCCPRVCCPPSTTAPAVVGAPKASGGLLGDTSAYRENPERPGTWVWTKPGIDLRSYDDLLIEEVRVQPAAGSTFAALPEAQRAAAAQALHAAVLKTVAPYYEVVQAPGAHTLRVRVALTSVPGGDGSGPASLEAELLDGQSQERLVGALGTLSAAELAPAEGDETAAADRAHRAWAARLLRYLDTHVR